MGKVCFGIDVGGTTIKFGLFETDGKLLDKWEIVTRTEYAGVNVLPDISASVLAKLQTSGIAREDVIGIGIGVPGPVIKGKVSECVNLHWGPTDVRGQLEKLTGFHVEVGNDANVAAFGELWQGGAAGYKTVIVVTLGTGVGGGIIINGRIVEGAHGAGGEIGHAHVTDDIKEPCNCGNRGCLEQVASATGIVRLANEELRKDPTEPSDLRTGEVSAKAVFDAYKDGDVLAGRVVNRFARFLGIGLAAFSTVIDPEVIVIGGGVSRAGEPLI